jgi:hypothetical protein
MLTIHIVDMLKYVLHDSTPDIFDILDGHYAIDMHAAMAIGDTSFTKGHVSQLQSSSKLYKPSTEPEPTGAKNEKSYTQDEPQISLLFARELEENMGFNLVGLHNDWALHVEVFSIQEKGCFSCHGLLSSHSQRCS